MLKKSMVCLYNPPFDNIAPYVGVFHTVLVQIMDYQDSVLSLQSLHGYLVCVGG